MNITDAVDFQGSFDAVMDGSASDAQCAEVKAVAHDLGVYLREAAARAVALPERRTAFLSLLSGDTLAKVTAAVASKDDAPARLVLDDKTGEVAAPVREAP